MEIKVGDHVRSKWGPLEVVLTIAEIRTHEGVLEIRFEETGEWDEAEHWEVESDEDSLPENSR